jgi:hypothetical protein
MATTRSSDMAEFIEANKLFDFGEASSPELLSLEKDQTGSTTPHHDG